MFARFMVFSGIILLIVGILVIVAGSIPQFAEVVAQPFCEDVDTNFGSVTCELNGEEINVTEWGTGIGVAMTIIGSLDLAFGFVVGIAALSGKLNHILKVGESAQATILSVESTGVRVNEQPMLKFRLQVQPNYGQAYEAETNRIIPYHIMPYLTLGMTVPVKYLPNKPEDVALDLENLTVQPMGMQMQGFQQTAGAMPKQKGTVDLSAKLAELQESYEQGLINQEEYEAARKRILGSF